MAVAGSTTLIEGAESSPGHDNNKFTVAHTWLLCGSLSFSIYVLYLFALLTGSMEPGSMLILPKRVRLIIRPIIGLVMLLLPLAHDRLRFIKTLSIFICLIAFSVMWEIATSTAWCENLQLWTER